MYRFFTAFIFLCVTVTVIEAQVFRYADSLRNAGDFTMAAIEYERCFYSATSRETAEVALRHKAECYKSTGDYSKAAETWQRCSASLDDYIQCSLCLFLSGQYQQSAETAHIAALALDTATTELLLIETLSYNELQKYNLAQASAMKLVETLPKEQQKHLQTLVDSFYSATPKLKSEQVAQWLSILPGMGHIYAGYWAEGITALILNTAALGFGVWQVMERCYVTAYIGGAGILSATWPGAIKSAVEHTKKNNKQRTYKFNEEFKNQIIPLLNH